MPEDSASQRTVRPGDEADYRFVIGEMSGDELWVTRFFGSEQISRLFHFRLELCSENPDLDPGTLVNQPCVLEIAGAAGTRYVHGLVRRFERLGESATRSYYAADIVPNAWMLTRRIKSRIFQEESCPDMTVPGVIEKVLTDAGFTGDDYRLALSGTYPAREYIVQYRESEMDFIQRLMEQEGIFYFFEHTAEGHKMVIGDDPVSHALTPNTSEFAFREKTGLLSELDQEYVYGLADQAELHIGAVGLDEYNFKQPATQMHASAQSDMYTSLEYMDWGKYDEKEDGQRYARIRKEEFEAARRTQTMHTCIRALIPGFKFTLKEHPAESLNREYLVTGIVHEGFQPQAGEQDADGSRGLEYRSVVTTIPSDVPFRPQRVTRRPCIQGVQTATVVGPEGEELHTDEYGRVRVHFPWEPEGVQSRWVRVNYPMAGGGYGFMFLPRVGQEVLVAYENGDPDEPYVVGRLYNNDQMPPYKLPDEKTKSTIKTNSSPGGGGTNELRFEDKKGEEQILLHAEKDLHVRAKNDRVELAGNDHHNTVGNDQIEEIQHSRSIKVAADDAIEIGGKRSMTVSGNVMEDFQANHSEKVASERYIKAATVLIEADSITLKSGGNFVVINATGVQIKGTMVLINSGGAALPSTIVDTVAGPKTPAAPDEATPGQDVSYTFGPREFAQVEPGEATISEPEAEAPPERERTWVEFQLLDDEHNPVPDEPYRVTLPDDTVQEGVTDAEGVCRFQEIEPGTARIQFPNRGDEEWVYDRRLGPMPAGSGSGSGGGAS